jgi:hypothetical protein
MKTRRARWSVLVLPLGVALAPMMVALPRGQAQGGGSVSVGTEASEPVAAEGQAALGAALEGPVLGIQSLVGSGVETTNCYQENKAQTLCFTVYNGSTDGGRIERIVLTMPDDPSPSLPAWTVSSCLQQDPQDSVGFRSTSAARSPGMKCSI